MSDSATVRTKCRSCGFETAVNSGDWERVTLPNLGTVTRCPECGSTDTTRLG